MTGVAALVPMRHESERVPGKNYRPFCGRPLFHHIVETLLACKQIDQVVIDTDSPAIKSDAAQSFPTVLFVDRPEDLRDGGTPMNDVLLHTVTELEADLFVQTHSTNPLLRSDTVDRAIDAFQGSGGQHDSLFSVSRLQTRLWNSSGTPVNHDPRHLLRTQDLEPLFEENSNLYIFERATLERYRSRIGENPMLFEVDAMEAWDIDDESDFVIAECLLRMREDRTS